MKVVGVMQLDKYVDLVNNITDCEGYINDDKELLAMLPGMFFAYVVPDAATKLSNRLRDFGVACYMYTSSTTAPLQIQCVFVEFIHPDYYKF